MSIASTKISSGDVDVSFTDGGLYKFHGLWLRDACRDEEFYKNAAGERVLSKTVIICGPEDTSEVVAVEAEVQEGGEALWVRWSDALSGCFPANFLRSYAKTSALPIREMDAAAVDTAWLEPYMHTVNPTAPRRGTIDLWTRNTGPAIVGMPYAETQTPEGNLKLLQILLRNGVVQVKDVPTPGEPRLHQFVDSVLGGLQKDPSRKEANWKIEHKATAASISYNPDLRLNNHTDQSLANHGIPGLLLVMHYAKGHGANTLVDGFAVAEALKERDPDAFRLLSTHGNDQERNVTGSRQDAKQSHQGSLVLTSTAPIIQLDRAGNVQRVQYNEVYRSPCTLPFGEFAAWYAAYVKFARMLHDPEFERNIPMATGDFNVVLNWRVLHGRAGSRDGSPSGLQSEDRVLVGGTVTREAVFSRARALMNVVHGVALHGPRLLSSSL